MSRQDSYFQFPLCALAFGADPVERLNHITSYCAVELGKGMRKKRGDEACELMVDGYLSTGETNEDFDGENPQHRSIMTGLIVLKEADRSIQQTVTEHAALAAHISRFESRYGTDAFPRIRDDIFRDALSGKMKYPTFAVYAALVSLIGDKACMRVTKEMVQPRALGYKSEAVMRSELQSRTDGETPLKLHQICHQLCKTLPKRKLIVRARRDERHTFYSHKLSQRQLEDTVLSGEKGKGNRKRSEANFMAQCKAARLEGLDQGKATLTAGTRKQCSSITTKEAELSSQSLHSSLHKSLHYNRTGNRTLLTETGNHGWG